MYAIHDCKDTDHVMLCSVGYIEKYYHYNKVFNPKFWGGGGGGGGGREQIINGH